jgi:ABC-type branched-subunit amino acid transport system substrate-binding protein
MPSLYAAACPTIPGMSLRAAAALTVLITLLSGCAAPPRTIKIALVGPFEGRDRQTAYDAFPAFRLALRAARPVNGWRIMFIAYTDDADPDKARIAARNLVRDPEVVAVIGHLTLTGTLAAEPIYREAGLALLVPHLPADLVPAGPTTFRLGPSQTVLRERAAACAGCAVFDAPELSALPAAQTALADFTALSLGPQPTRGSIIAYDSTRLLIDAVTRDIRQNGTPTRAGVLAALRDSDFAGMLGRLTFDDQGVWREAPVFAE